MSTSEARSHDFRRRKLITDCGGTATQHCRVRRRTATSLRNVALLVLLLVMSNNVVITALPFPPPDLSMCGMAFNTTEGCCTLPLRDGTQPLKKFTLGLEHLPLRIRRPAHLLDAAYIAKYELAMSLMRALPETDGRSFTAQYRLHCAYCNNHLYYPDNEYPLEIHQSWFFLPWHRLFLFFHERILANLIDDDTFALPFWNWDSQNATAPFPNALPWIYYNNVSSSADTINQTNPLWDPDRNACSKPPRLVEFQDFIQCDPRPDPNVTRVQNSHMMWTQMVSVGVTPLVMAGGEYRFGDPGALGMGAIEARPHGPMHAWTNVRDMGTFKVAASDPAFFALHGNLDRLWEVWKTLPGRFRGEVVDADYLETEFTFYDENGDQVAATVKDFLDVDRIGIKYEEVANAWAEKGAPQVNGDASWAFCNPNSSEAGIDHLISNTARFEAPMYVDKGPLTFTIKRRPDLNESYGEEMLELRMRDFTWHRQHTLNLFAYLSNATYETTSIGCLEYIGTLQSFPHPGISPNMTSEMVYRAGIRRKLELMGRTHLSHVVLTLVGQSYVGPTSPGESGLNITSAEIIYATE